MPEPDWDHLRVFLATMRSGSLRGAAELLSLSHPTARRHLNSLEQSLGLTLFHRRTDGLHPTLEAQKLLDSAVAVERSVQALSRVADAAAPGMSGALRVSIPQIFGTDLLAPYLAEFSSNWPKIQLQVDSSYALADLDKREADVAIRAMSLGKLPAEHLTGKRAGTVYRAVYGEGNEWIGWQGPEKDAEWIRESEFPHLPSRSAFSDPLIQRSLCVAGAGITRLPCFLAHGHLTPRTEPEPAFDVWVLVHPDLRTSARVRKFRDHIVSAMKKEKCRLEGRS